MRNITYSNRYVIGFILISLLSFIIEVYLFIGADTSQSLLNTSKYLGLTITLMVVVIGVTYIHSLISNNRQLQQAAHTCSKYCLLIIALYSWIFLVP